jgi:hypothetical protein
MTTGQRSALMPSTPLAYPQVNRIVEPDSIPGSSTKKAAGQSIKVPFAELRQDPAGRYLAAFDDARRACHAMPTHRTEPSRDLDRDPNTPRVIGPY